MPRPRNGWRTDIGPLGQVLLLRGFETADALGEERRRALMSRDPFNGGGIVGTLEMESYEACSFLPSVFSRTFGGVYEFRTDVLKPGGLAPTLEGWRAAIGPAKEYTDHLVINMFALDGRPRITHIWGFGSLAQRSDLRNRHDAAGVWPPKGGPETIEVVTATLETSPAMATHWNTGSMAKVSGVSISTVHRIWRAFPLQPPGQVERRTQDYKRHGTTSLFAAWDIKAGTIISKWMPRHRAAEFRRFLDTIERNTNPAID